MHGAAVRLRLCGGSGAFFAGGSESAHIGGESDGADFEPGAGSGYGGAVSSDGSGGPAGFFRRDRRAGKASGSDRGLLFRISSGGLGDQ